MSNRLDLDMDTDLADGGREEPLGEWDEDLLEDFPQDDPASLAPSFPVAAKQAVPVAAAPQAGDRPPPAKARRRKKRRGGGGIALLSGLLVVLGGGIVGAGALLAAGGTYEVLLDFSGLRDVTALGDFNSHPVNAFWVAAAIVVLAACLVVLGIQRRVGRLQEVIDDQDALLAAVGMLDPDAPESWRQEILLADADLAAATGNLLGHYHLQQAKLTRYVGLEGELQRLEKAMAEDSLADLQGEWENPGVGSLADQALRLIQARDEQAADQSSLQETLAAEGPDLIAGLREARAAQAAILEQINRQRAVSERIGRRLGRLAEAVPRDGRGGLRRQRLAQAVAAIREALAGLPGRGGAARAVADGGLLAALPERASRLAFQIAMEVARLGAKGERLLPLTQDLEELTTELRGLAEQGKAQPGADDPRDRFVELVGGRLAELDPEPDGPDQAADLGAALGELAPQADEHTSAFAVTARQCTEQVAQLRRLSGKIVTLLGLEADEDDDSPASPQGGLQVDRYDPFASGSQQPGGLVADPFAGSGVSIFETERQAQPDFVHQVLPGAEESLLQAATPEPSLLDLEPAPATAAARDEAPQAGLPPAGEKVYDLAEFDAQLLPAEAGPDPSAARVHDLSEFAAVRIA